MSDDRRMPTLPDKAALLAQIAPSRAKWASAPRPPRIDPAGEGEESVWDYPRPPRVDASDAHLVVRLGDMPIAETRRARFVRETAGAPVPYFPPEDVRSELLVATDYLTVCEWKGVAVHHDLRIENTGNAAAAYTYPDPFDDLGQGFASIAAWFAFYPAKLACEWNGEAVRPQPGGYYGGWVIDRINGPIKGAPGTGGW